MKHTFLGICLVVALALLQFGRSNNCENRINPLSDNVEALAQSEVSGGACCKFFPGGTCTYIDDSGELYILMDAILDLEC